MTLPPVDHTHDPALACWVPGAQDHPDFPVQNLPFGVFAPAPGAARIGVAIGDAVLDLAAFAAAGFAPAACTAALAGDTLNALFALPAADRLALRHRLSALLGDAAQQPRLAPLLHERAACTLHLPFAIGDYTDFYTGIHHATKVGSLYRPEQPLTENYKHLPVGYHGKTASITVGNGGPVVRPHGQIRPAGADAPVFAMSRELDYELELGVWIGPGNPQGAPVAIADAPEQIAGLCLLNDWSARDLQHWERLPLGPFLGKSFHTMVSPWVVTAEALAPFRVPPHPRAAGDPAPLAYLADAGDAAAGQFAITLEAALLTPAMAAAGAPPVVLSRADARDMYWTIAQLVAHQTSNGCNLRPGDLLGSGTLSGPAPGEGGSLLEITRAGAAPLTLPDDETRTFLADGDCVILRGFAAAPGRVTIGLGACIGTVARARGGDDGAAPSERAAASSAPAAPHRARRPITAVWP